ncbi:hypothetical protein M431DRAFT_301293 [Trichoderma harzianum CBS 226.95]|uniref:Uncharacterized protein n=1 Tax=Trichoderma harzianum CBS 226.95 TaxID=983964 RepID=A0A2T4AQL0_TRIHA|nr:hypothetical protein M431DRAFT_301293 [Trichoderma harzianum CBS 226.95]PTB59351.1 hypothetical protein M431DRAFT_301293 [Trichoderma harzianum CBS 226.95]
MHLCQSRAYNVQLCDPVPWQWEPHPSTSQGTTCAIPTNALLLLLRLLSRGIPPNRRPIFVDRQYDTLQQPPMSNTQRYFVQGERKGELVQSIVRDNPNPECARSGPPPFFPQPIQPGGSDPQEKIKQ